MIAGKRGHALHRHRGVGDGVALDLTDAPLILALRSGAIGGAGADPEVPVPGEGVQPRMQDHLPAPHIVADDQRPGVVEQNLPGHAAERM